MRAGKLRHRVQIQQRNSERDEFGQALDTWITLDIVSANIVGLSGREFLSRSGEAADATHRIEMRAWAGLSPSHRIVFGTRIFDVQYVSDIDQRGIEMHLICKERAA